MGNVGTSETGLRPEQVCAVLQRGLSYPAQFDPPERYPEYPLSSTSSGNGVYPQVRSLLREMGCDAEHYGTAAWNPLGGFIRPGDKVVLKPNLVRDYNPVDESILSLVTHASIIRAMVDYCFIAMKGEGEIVIADAPLQSARFQRVVDSTGIGDIPERYRTEKNFRIEVVDLRKVTSEPGHSTRKAYQEGDPLGYTILDLARESCHAGRAIDTSRYRVTDYDPKQMAEAHNGLNHCYCISNTILSADAVINLPKLKTHRKAGMTGALKNLIGINCLKDFLPHHTVGSSSEGGDEYLNPSALKKLQSALFDARNQLAGEARWRCAALESVMRTNAKLIEWTRKDPFFEGSWYGNDTIWRTILDLNRILIYADKGGTMRPLPQRKLLVVVDAVIAGEGEGPLEPTAKPCGLLLGGTNSVAVDLAACGMMGFDHRKIPQVSRAFDLSSYPIASFGPEDVRVSLAGRSHRPTDVEATSAFTPPAGWLDSLGGCGSVPVRMEVVDDG